MKKIITFFILEQGFFHAFANITTDIRDYVTNRLKYNNSTVLIIRFTFLQRDSVFKSFGFDKMLTHNNFSILNMQAMSLI